MPAFKKRSYKKRAPKKSARGGKKSSAVSSAVKGYVKKAIAADLENKQVAATTITSFGSILQETSMNSRPILPYTGYGPLILQGVGQGGRVGNSCKIKSVFLNYVLYPLPYDVVTNPNPTPFHVQMFLGNVRQYKGILPQSTDVNLMFQLGSSTVAPQGTLIDLCSQINTDDWDIKKKWDHKLGYATSGGTGTSAIYQSYANNDFKLNVVRKMNITKHCNSLMKFNDAASTISGSNLFLFFQAISCNGGAYGATVQVARIQYQIIINYEDA